MRPLSQVWLSALRAPDGAAFTRAELALVPPGDIAKLGRITKPETMNYRTLAPEKGGLYCVEAFGDGDAFPERAQLSSKDAWDHPRATTFARFELPVPVIHPLAVANAYDDVVERVGLDVRATLHGGDEDAWTTLRAKLEHPDVAPLLVHSILVLPPYLRPMVPLDGGRWATSDVNDLYRRAINRANRLARLVELGAPAIITNNEERMLYDALDSLLANELRDQKVTAPDDRALVSLWGLARDDRFDALAESERHAPLTRERQTQLAAIRAMGFELRPASSMISASVTTLGVPL